MTIGKLSCSMVDHDDDLDGRRICRERSGWHIEGAGQCNSEIDLGRTAGVGSHASCVAEFEGTVI